MFDNKNKHSLSPGLCRITRINYFKDYALELKYFITESRHSNNNKNTGHGTRRWYYDYFTRK